MQTSNRLYKAIACIIEKECAVLFVRHFARSRAHAHTHTATGPGKSHKEHAPKIISHFIHIAGETYLSAPFLALIVCLFYFRAIEIQDDCHFYRVLIKMVRQRIALTCTHSLSLLFITGPICAQEVEFPFCHRLISLRRQAKRRKAGMRWILMCSSGI